MNVAVIDIGTNSTRLLVTGSDGELARTTVITRLGQGVDRSRRLAPEAVERTLAVLRDYRARCDALGVARIRAVTTSATRDAQDRDAFLAAASEALGGAPVDLLSGDDEGRYAFAGATAWLTAADGPAVVVDIGGGSTEFVVGTPGQPPDGVISVDMGSVRLTESHVASDPPRPEELTNALGVVADHLDDVLRELPGIAEARTVVGVAGTVTTVVAVELGMATYRRELVHRFRLTRDAAEDVFRTLATETLDDRVHNPGLPRERADVIVGGCCVLVGIMRRLGLDEIVVSETDILDGVAAELLAAG